MTIQYENALRMTMRKAFSAISSTQYDFVSTLYCYNVNQE